MTDQEYAKDIARRKQAIENKENDLKHQIAQRRQWLEENPESPKVAQWKQEMAEYQQRYVDEPERETAALCREIQQQRGIGNAFSRNTAAVGDRSNSEEWARRMLGA